MELDSYYMEIAIALAKRASSANEVPVGAIIVDKNGNVVAEAFNSVEKDFDSTMHAEIKCISKLSRLIKSWRLNEYTMYSTLEPCKMCLGAIHNSRISKLVYATKRNKEVEAKLVIVKNVMEDESKELLKAFFNEKR